MGSNALGELFRIVTWGESHGKAVGVVIDGCPAGIELSEEELQGDLDKRAPGRDPLTSERAEEDRAEILSGVFEEMTTGAPISIIIRNKDADPSKYDPIKHLLRPGHANATYLAKYGIFDHRGGGRASARETVCRVAAGSVAKKLLLRYGILVRAFLEDQEETLRQTEEAKKAGDSIGGVVAFEAENLPAGLGDPVYGKLEALLASAMLSIPASKGFEIGSGFAAAKMRGSLHNDRFGIEEGSIKLQSNHSGGTLGGISTGMPLFGKVAFKPPSSIFLPQETVTTSGEPAVLHYPEGSRHDPCLAIRAVPVVEAMLALVLADAVLKNRLARV